MAKNNTFSVKFRRRRQGATNYKKRLALLKSGKPRVVVRSSNRYITISLVKYNTKGDEVKSLVRSDVLKSFGIKTGFNNLSSAYLTGYYFAKHYAPKGEVIIDLGLRKPARRVMSVLRGLNDGGLKFHVNEEKLPSMEVINSRYDTSKYLKDLETKKAGKTKKATKTKSTKTKKSTKSTKKESKK